jgi:phosphopantetheinyl transferase (holo-ACP synthase)
MTGFTELTVGNDVVDLRDPEGLGKHDNKRWLARVLAAREVADFGHRMTHVLLWRLWTAKESAYKIVKKEFGTSPKARELSVRVETTEEGARGVVDTHHGPIQARWTVDEDFVHCVAWWPHVEPIAAQSRIVAAVRSAEDPSLRNHRLTEREALSAKNPASCAARSVARSLIQEQGSQTAELEIVRDHFEGGFGPPRLERGGRVLPGYDLSLSHHGRFVAAAVSHPSGVFHHG